MAPAQGRSRAVRRKGRTQRGNNNAYCQDNEVSWLDWAAADRELLDFLRRLIRFRREHPVFLRRRWFQGRPIHGTGVDDIGWFTHEGEEMTEEDWQAGFAKTLAVFLNGEAIPSPGPRGERIVDESFLVLFNAHHEAIGFKLPGPPWGRRWELVFDTVEGRFLEEERQFGAGDRLEVQPRCLVVLGKSG
jgi:glycogen operon protein